MVEHADTAWHAQCYNGRSIGIEHEGYVQDPARWYTDAMYTESAKLTRYITDRHGIPKTRTRIIGHVEVAEHRGGLGEEVRQLGHEVVGSRRELRRRSLVGGLRDLPHVGMHCSQVDTHLVERHARPGIGAVDDLVGVRANGHVG